MNKTAVRPRLRDRKGGMKRRRGRNASLHTQVVPLIPPKKGSSKAHSGTRACVQRGLSPKGFDLLPIWPSVGGCGGQLVGQSQLERGPESRAKEHTWPIYGGSSLQAILTEQKISFFPSPALVPLGFTCRGDYGKVQGDRSALGITWSRREMG